MGSLQIAPLMVAWGFGRFYWRGLPWPGKVAAVAIALAGIWWYVQRHAKRGLRLPALGWIFVLLLSAAPVLVGAAEGTMREFPEKELVSDQPFSLLADAILPSVVGPALLVGVVGYCSMLIANSEWFDEAAPNSRTVVVGSLVLLTVAVLWLAVVWVHWNVTMVQRIGFRDVRPIALPSQGSWP